MGLLDEYREEETNQNYDYSAGGLLKEYAQAPAKGLTTGLAYLLDVPYLLEGAGRGAFDLVSSPFDMMMGSDKELFSAFNNNSWVTDPYGSKIIEHDKENGNYLTTENYDVPLLPDPQAINTGFQWGGLGGINFGKNVLTKPFSMERGLNGLGFGTGSEYLQEGLNIDDPNNMWGMAVDTPALFLNLVKDWRSFRNDKGFISKMVKETFGDIPDEKIQAQLSIMQQRLADAKKQGVKLSAQQLFEEFPEVAKLYRVLSQMDNGATTRFNAEQGEILTNLLSKGADNLDELPSLLQAQKVIKDNYKNFQTNTNKVFREDIDAIKNTKIIDGVGNNGNMKTLLTENIDMAWNRIGNRSSVGGKQLEYFTNLIDDAIRTGDIDTLNNTLRRIDVDLENFASAGMSIDNNIVSMEKGLDTIVRQLVDDSHLAIADNFDDYNNALNKYKKTMETSIDPLRTNKLMALITEGGDPEGVIKAIDVLFTSPNYSSTDLAPIVKALRNINGDGVIDQVFQMHITSLIKQTFKGTSDDAMGVVNKLSNKKQSYDRIKTLIREDYKIKNGEYPSPSQLDDASRGMISFIDTVNTFTKSQAESLTQPLQAFQRSATQYGFDPRDLVNPSTWTDEIRDAWAKFNAQKLQKFLENSSNLDELIKMSKHGISDDIINLVYHGLARPYGTVGGDKMPYGFNAKSVTKDAFQELDADKVLQSGEW